MIPASADVAARTRCRIDAAALSGPRFAALPPLSLYVHIPWCLKKCPYCDFNSHEAKGEAPEAAYVDALIADLEFALPSIWGRRVVSIFIGGGTPSLFSAAAIDRLLAGIRARVPLAPDAEITLEANPGTFEREKFAGYRAAGVNRLSLGIQSFDPKHLAAIGRVHDEDEARRAAEAALAIFGNVNFDLMYALPRQTVAEAEADVEAALAFSPPHLSFYHLTLEPNTLFHRYPPPLPDDETTADIEDAVHSTLDGGGLPALRDVRVRAPRPRMPPQSQLLAVRRLSRHRRRRAFEAFVRRSHRPPGALQATEAVPGADRRGRAAPGRRRRDARGHRLRVHAERAAPDRRRPGTLFAERTGYPLTLVRRGLEAAEARGLIERDPSMLRPTALGRRFLNDLQQLFLAD